jgi:DnaJ-class molecular chaperone
LISYYQILNVDESASWEQIKSAYLKLTAVIPKDSHLRELIEQAYSVLKDPDQKKQYFTNWPDVKELYHAHQANLKLMDEAAEKLQQQTELIRKARQSGNWRNWGM